MTRRVLVTGGSGFIGTRLVEALLARGDEVVNLDIRPPKLDSHRACWRQMDLLDQVAVKALVEEIRPAAILNLAAVADIALRFDEMPVNTIGLENLIEAMRPLAERPRLVHVSTQLVVRPGYTPSRPREYAPYSEYGKTKAASEEILWETDADIAWTIVRPTNVWGPFHPSFPASTWKYLNRRWYMMPTGADPLRSYGYVGNVAAQMVAAATIDPGRVDRKVFYVGDAPIASARWLDGFSFALAGKPVRRIPGSFLKLLAEAGEAMKRIGGPAPLDRGRLYRITTDYAVPMAEGLQTLGSGRFSLEEGIEETVGWLRREMPQEYAA